MNRNGLAGNRLIQMCIITTEGDRMNANWARLLGFDYTGLAVYDDPDGRNTPMSYHGKVVTTAGIASNSVDLVEDGKWLQFEVLEARKGPSEWNDFMQLRGRGLHHMAFEIEDPKTAIPAIEAFSGSKIIQEGATVMQADCYYGYLDTKQGMGTTIELLGFGGQLQQTRQYRSLMTRLDLQGSRTDLPLAGKVPAALTLIAENAADMAGKYRRFLDAEPVSEGMINDSVTRGGHTTSQRYEKSVFDLESTMLEILGPDDSDTVWADFQDQWKDGLFGMVFESDDLEGDVRKLEGCLLHPVQYGSWDGTEYVILDGTADYGCMIELRTSQPIREHLSRVKAERAEHARRYGSNRKYNEATGIGHIFADPDAVAKLKKANPAFAMMEKYMANKTVKRMPLGFVLRSIPGMTEDEVLRLLDVVNR